MSLGGKEVIQIKMGTNTKSVTCSAKAHDDIGEKRSVGTYFRTQKAHHVFGEVSFKKKKISESSPSVGNVNGSSVMCSQLSHIFRNKRTSSCGK